MNFDDDFDEDDFDADWDASDEAAFQQEQQKQREFLSNHPLNVQAQEILRIIVNLMATAPDPEKADLYLVPLRESAMIILAKLAGALPSESYLVRMQNAAAIREHAEQLRLANHLFTYDEVFEKEYIHMFRNEMETFRQLFREWATEIRKMESEVEDEWGLF